MSTPSVDLTECGRFSLPAEWRQAADLAARNLGMNRALFDLPAEHWQLVLVNVDARMRMRNVEAQVGWRTALGQQVGRH